MRCVIPFLSVVFLASCGQPTREESGSPSMSETTSDSTEMVAPPKVRFEAEQGYEPTTRGPGIGPTAAPGVAFNYRYAFRLPGARIGAVQEAHASACEKLTVARCRITGLRYRLVNQTDVEGRMSFKLDPTIARHFGKAAIETVAQAEGILVDSEISGVDAGTAIQAANRSVAQLNDDLRRIETQLAQRGVLPDERTRLGQEADRIRQAIRATQASREEQEESLATTPMSFTYGSGDLVPGFDTQSPMRNAIEDAGNNFISGFAVLFVIVLTVLPWALLFALGWWLFTRLAQRFRPVRRERAEPVQPEASGSS